MGKGGDDSEWLWMRRIHTAFPCGAWERDSAR